MKIWHLINKLSYYDQEAEIKIIAENGLHLEPTVKMVLKDKFDILNHSKDNIDYLVLTTD